MSDTENILNKLKCQFGVYFWFCKKLCETTNQEDFAMHGISTCREWWSEVHYVCTVGEVCRREQGAGATQDTTTNYICSNHFAGQVKAKVIQYETELSKPDTATSLTRVRTLSCCLGGGVVCVEQLQNLGVKRPRRSVCMCMCMLRGAGRWEQGFWEQPLTCTVFMSAQH